MKRFLKKIVIAALTFEARLVLRKYKPRIVAVTGNVGKTSAKDAIYAVLAGSFYVRKSEKSFNSEIGVPLTILGCQTGWHNPIKWLKNILEGFKLILLKNHYPAWLVLEVGADHPGDIESISRYLRPDVAVLTHIGEVPVHVEFFNSADELAAEKAHLVRALKEGGACIVNADDARTRKIGEECPERTFFFGTSEQAHVRATNEQILYDAKGKPEAINFKINYGGASVPVTIAGTAGIQFARSALAAAALGLALEINLVDIAARISQGFTPQAGRMRVVEGKNGSVILDDSYNASPAATESALKALEEMHTTGRKIAVLGDMMELGRYSTDAHHSMGALAARASNLFIAVGPRMKQAAETAEGPNLKEGNVEVYSDAQAAGEYVSSIAQKGDIILIKGSQSMHMERAVELLMAHPERKEELLVRQEPEWKEK